MQLETVRSCDSQCLKSRSQGYRFYLSSDDGGQLFLDCVVPSIDLVGSAPVPDPQTIAIGQPLFDRQECRWAETEGMIIFIQKSPDRLLISLVGVYYICFNAIVLMTY
jgi:hypothetical protein